MERTAIFIDAGYFNKVLKDFNIKVDYLKLSESLASGCNRLRTYYYDCPHPHRPQDKGFRIHNELKQVCDDWIFIDNELIDSVKVEKISP